MKRAILIGFVALAGVLVLWSPHRDSGIDVEPPAATIPAHRESDATVVIVHEQLVFADEEYAENEQDCAPGIAVKPRLAELAALRSCRHSSGKPHQVVPAHIPCKRCTRKYRSRHRPRQVASPCYNTHSLVAVLAHLYPPRGLVDCSQWVSSSGSSV
jgi:hypothetical protein